MLIREINDPRLERIYVTDVKVDKELAWADVYVSAVEGASRSAEVLAGLDSASGFLRRALSSRVELRAFPRLRAVQKTRRGFEIPRLPAGAAPRLGNLRAGARP